MDTDFVPTGEARLRQIMDAVVTEGDAAEYLGLEAKSDIDPSRKGPGIAKIAKFILGMANRMPKVASRHFKGYGVMVIGVEKGSAAGIAKGVEAHELAERLSPYLGPVGPRWDLARLSTSPTHEVLFVVVDPPEEGQALFLCHKDFQPSGTFDAKVALSNGEIYVRDKSQTRKATAAEVQALLSRGMPPSPNVNIHFGVTGQALFVKDTESGLRHLFRKKAEKTRGEAGENRLTTAEEDSKQAQGLRPRPKDGGSQGGESPSTSGAEMERAKTLLQLVGSPVDSFGVQNRTQLKDPEKEIKERENRWWSRWPACLENLYAVSAEPIVFSLENRAASYLPKPEVVVTISSARAITAQDFEEVEDHEVLPFLDMPNRGPYYSFLAPVDHRSIRSVTSPVEVSWRNLPEGDVEVILTPSALRPSRIWRGDNELALVALDPEATELKGTWSLTAEGFGQRFEGFFAIPVLRVGDALDLIQAYMREAPR